MDGLESDKFANFKSLVTAGLKEAKANLEEIESLIQILAKGKFSIRSFIFLDSKMPCFIKSETLISEIRTRLTPTPAGTSFLGLLDSSN